MKVLLFANTDWYLFNFRRSLALRIRQSGHEVLLVSPPGPYGERLRDLGLLWQPAPMRRRSLNPLREFALILWLCALMRRERIDLVHGFTIKCAVYGALAARLVRVPARVSAVAGMGYTFISGDPLARFLRPVVSFLMRVALGGARARVILQNPDDVAFFKRERLADPAQIRLIPGSGVDCSTFIPRPPQTSRSAGRFRVLLPARLLWDKGLAEYVEASRILREQGREFEFLLAGERDRGNPAAVPEATVREWTEAGWVQWLGYTRDMPALFHTVDAVVLPSYREGLPKGLIEAGACGLPLITTDVPGCREVVTDGVDGLLVPARDAHQLAAAIAKLHDDETLRFSLGRAARDKVVTHFDEQIIISKTFDVYEELLPSATWTERVPADVVD